MFGRVYLVGAGPGDPELLTLKALRILQQADIVLHDDLVPPSILNLAPPGADVVNVGKRCGRKFISQAEINARMIAGSRLGLSVVRLKGGDPSIFGRSGEEIEALREAEVEFEIVPGVTAASAAAATAGISLTQRGMASSVTFMTGHRASDHAASDGFETSGAPRDPGGRTTVVYMPGPDYGSLQTRLLNSGIAADTPCLVVTAASRDANRKYQTVVGQLVNIPRSSGPNILIVGEVTKLAQESLRLSAEALPALFADINSATIPASQPSRRSVS